MSREPSYPDEAPVGGGAAETGEETPAKADANSKRKKPYVRAGVAVGIGSAAIVAALLYANRSKRDDRGNN
jgi:hypothetical protein